MVVFVEINQYYVLSKCDIYGHLKIEANMDDLNSISILYKYYGILYYDKSDGKLYQSCPCCI